MEFCNGGSEHRPVLMASSSHREAKKAKIRAELLARRERRILEEEVRRELGWERGIRFGCCHGEREEFYDYEPEVEGLRRHRMGFVDRRIGEDSRASREAKKKKIRAELLARMERRVLEEEVRRELGLEREETSVETLLGLSSWDKFYDYEPEVDGSQRCLDVDFEKSRALRDDGCLVPRLGFEGHHLPTCSKDLLRRSPAVLLDLRLRPAGERSASPPEENIQPLAPDFLPLNCVEPELSSRPSLVVVDSVSKHCVEPVSSPKLLPMVIGPVYEPEPRPSVSSPVPENKPSSNDYYSGNKRKFACDLCQITATSKESLDDHFNGKRHKALTASNNISVLKSSAEDENFNKPKNRPAGFLCKVCGLKFDSRYILYAHINEKKHRLRPTGN